MSFIVRVAILLSVRIGRIELPLTDWQPVVIPLDHIRISNRIYNNRKTYTFHFSAPARTRTRNLFVRSEALYPLSYRRRQTNLTLIYDSIQLAFAAKTVFS